jgi:hypothetical protein
MLCNKHGYSSRAISFWDFYGLALTVFIICKERGNMSTTKQPEKETQDKQTEAKPVLQSFYVPEYGHSVEATSLAEAVEKAKKLKEDK